MKNLKTGVSSTFRQSPVLTILSVAFSVYIVSLITLAIILAVAPQSKIGSMVDNLF